MKIRQLIESDLEFTVRCAFQEGWTSENEEVFKGFLEFDPEGCFLAEIDGQPIGFCIATPYKTSGFIGEFIIVRKMRGQGRGRILLDHALNYLKERGIQNVFLDAVPLAVSLYERMGFQKICRSLRFSGLIKGRKHGQVQSMESKDLVNVIALDRHAFGDDRSFFLKRLYRIYPDLCKVLKIGRQIVGYIFGRTINNSITLGPWIVINDTIDPSVLIETISLEAVGRSLNIGILETNHSAVCAVRILGLHQKADAPYRMVLRTSNQIDSNLGMTAECYGIGSPAKG